MSTANKNSQYEYQIREEMRLDTREAIRISPAPWILSEVDSTTALPPSKRAIYIPQAAVSFQRLSVSSTYFLASLPGTTRLAVANEVWAAQTVANCEHRFTDYGRLQLALWLFYLCPEMGKSTWWPASSAWILEGKHKGHTNPWYHSHYSLQIPLKRNLLLPWVYNIWRLLSQPSLVRATWCIKYPLDDFLCII